MGTAWNTDVGIHGSYFPFWSEGYDHFEAQVHNQFDLLICETKEEPYDAIFNLSICIFIKQWIRFNEAVYH